ncbi:MAG TPA: class I SAM-dependent methyltransferase [Anaerolineae bacterium]|nr:class I SAM-dependent methyltransferase [Anaerolineae bacterium]
MTQADVCRVYEQESMRQVLGDTLRPGGLALTVRALDFCALPAGAKVLDVGCGAGATVQLLRDHGCWAGGLDLSAVLLQSGRQGSPRLPFVQADGVRLPLVDGQLDAILAECSLSILAEVETALAEFNRLLRPGGYLIISDIYARNPAGLAALRELPLDSCLKGAFNRPELAAQLAGDGFELVMWEDHSEVLKHLAGQLAMTHGSLAEFWRKGTGSSLDAWDVQLAMARAKPGYFLLIARKGRPADG